MLFLEDSLDRADSPSAAVVDLDDLELDFLVQQDREVFHPAVGSEGSGDEYLQAVEVDQDAALDDIGNGAGQDSAFFKSFADGVVVGLRVAGVSWTG